MRRGAVALAVLAALVFSAAPCLAAYPTPTKLRVSIQEFLVASQSIHGDTDPSQLVDMRIVMPGGRVRGVSRALSDASGNFTLSLRRQRLEPGDTLEIMLGGNPAWTYRMTYSTVRITGLNVAAGAISGVVTPRKRRIALLMSGERVIPDPVNVAKVINVTWHTPPDGKATDAAGRFTVTPTLVGLGWEGRYRRTDVLQTLYQVLPVTGNPAFRFTVSTFSYIPGMITTIGTHFQQFLAVPGRTYVATLLAPGGAVKGSAHTTWTLYTPLLPLHKADGVPATIASGDTIRVTGLGGFTTPVPRLAGAVGAASNTVRIVGPPGARIKVECTLYDDDGKKISPAPPATWVKTDAAGKATATPAADLRVGDQATLEWLDAKGNSWIRELQSLPTP